MHAQDRIESPAAATMCYWRLQFERFQSVLSISFGELIQYTLYYQSCGCLLSIQSYRHAYYQF